MSDSLRDDYHNEGHGHVFPRPDGIKARCGGPALCRICAIDLTRKGLGATEATLVESLQNPHRTINIMLYRAQPEETPHLNVTTNTSYFPYTHATNKRDLDINMELHRKQAKDLVDALYQTLPGGTMDQILRELLERKASQLSVTF